MTTEEEDAIVADPAAGAEHAVILAEEIGQDDAIGVLSRTTYHRRAKILSNEGRHLADIEIPLYSKEGSVKEWWGRTILPDGRTFETSEAELQEQSVLRKGWKEEIRLLKASLRGVEPGAVIDYGYVLRDVNARFLRRVPLQLSWPVRSFTYWWRPRLTQWGFGTCHLNLPTRLHVKCSMVDATYIVRGQDLPPIVEEPWMPPDAEVRAAAIFYYTYFSQGVAHFWKLAAIHLEEEVARFLKPETKIHQAITEMDLPADDGIEARLRAAFDWIGANVRNTGLLTAEEIEALSVKSDKKDGKADAEKILSVREASPWELDLLFLGIARSLGAEAHVVLTSERRKGGWEPNLLVLDQFSESLVTVREPGAPPGTAVLLDPGSGLPYGEIPWWTSGTKGFLVDPSEWREVKIPHSEADSNVSETRAEMTLAESGDLWEVRWSRTATGQHWLDERRTLRQLSLAERSERLAEHCGANGEFEIVSAVAPGLDDLGKPFQLRCEGELFLAEALGTSEELALHADGAWIEDLPEFTSQTRVHPLVFSFPRVDTTVLEVSAPRGFSAVDPPDPVSIDSLFGLFTRTVSRTDDGYRVERSLTLRLQDLPAHSYDGLRRFLDRVRLADRTPLRFSAKGGGS